MPKYYFYETLESLSPHKLESVLNSTESVDSMPMLNSIQWITPNIPSYSMCKMKGKDVHLYQTNAPWEKDSNHTLLWPLSSFIHMIYCLPNEIWSDKIASWIEKQISDIELFNKANSRFRDPVNLLREAISQIDQDISDAQMKWIDSKSGTPDEIAAFVRFKSRSMQVLV